MESEAVAAMAEEEDLASSHVLPVRRPDTPTHLFKAQQIGQKVH